MTKRKICVKFLVYISEEGFSHRVIVLDHTTCVFEIFKGDIVITEDLPACVFYFFKGNISLFPWNAFEECTISKYGTHHSVTKIS